MLEISKVQELVKIVAAASATMDKKGYLGYFILAVEWNDELNRWEVEFYTGDSEEVTVIRWVAEKQKGDYIDVGPFY